MFGFTAEVTSALSFLMVAFGASLWMAFDRPKNLISSFFSWCMYLVVESLCFYKIGHLGYLAMKNRGAAFWAQVKDSLLNLRQVPLPVNDPLEILVAVILIVMGFKVMHRFARALLIKLESAAVTGGFIPERMMEGSQFEKVSALPACQFELLVQKGGSGWLFAGNGFRSGTRLFTCLHVVAEAEAVKIRTNTGEYELPEGHDFVTVEGDVAMNVLPESVYSKLGLKSGNLNKSVVTKGHPVFAKVVSRSQQSFGEVVAHDNFGRVQYTGSTVAGFSGAPYVLNNTVLGMHTGAEGGRNLGYESGYLNMFVLRDDEDSDEWLIEQANKSWDLEYSQSPYDPDEFRVKIAGRYHIVDRDVMSRIKANKVNTHTSIDYVPETALPEARVPCAPLVAEEELPLAPASLLEFAQSGNLIRAPAVGAGARGTEEMVLESAQPQAMQRSAPTASKSRSKTSGLESRARTLAQQSGALQSIPKSAKKKSQLQKLRSKLERYQQRYGLMEGGEQTSPQPGTSSAGLIPNLPEQ